MKTLYIVRHGKSSWEFEKVKDIDRPLNERGIHDGADMAGRLKKMGRKPELIISSPATRALHTATIFLRTLEVPDKNIIIDRDLYQADIEDVLDVIAGIDEAVDSVMIFGHNPTVTDLANELTTLRLDNVPTTGIVIIEFNTSKWTELDKHHVSYQYFDYPKNA